METTMSMATVNVRYMVDNVVAVAARRSCWRIPPAISWSYFSLRVA